MTNFSDYIYRPQLPTLRNAIINANFNWWQRGTSFTSNAYTADMFPVGCNYDGSFTVTRGTGLSGEPLSVYSWLFTENTGDSTLAAGQYAHLVHKIEGTIYHPFIDRAATLSFWVKATVTGSYTVFFRDATYSSSYVIEYEIYESNTWEFKVVHLTFDDTIATWETGVNASLSMGWCFGCGSTYKTSSTDQWISGNYIAGSNQVNNVASSSNIFQLAQPQLEIGRVATPFEYLPAGVENRLVYRYYEIVNYTHDSGTSTTSGNGTMYAEVLHQQKRTTPTSVSWSGTVQIWSPQNGWRNASTTSSTSATAWRILVVFTDTGVSNYVAGNALLFQGTATIDAQI
jgi:hypothetical protein